jgi:glycosyltransferase involved in cell wall biosynthesis
MSYLIFCSFEVGGLPFKMAETLNRFGVETYYICLAKKGTGHDSANFHYGSRRYSWDLSDGFKNGLDTPKQIVDQLRRIRNKYRVSHCLATGGDVHFLRKAGIDYNYWSYGGDLDYECFFVERLLNTLIRMRFRINPVRMFLNMVNARKSIGWANSVMIAPYQERVLKRIFPEKGLFFLPHCINAKDYGQLLKERGESKKTISRKWGVENYFFSSTRHVWVGDWKNLTDNKRNDIMVRGYAKYLQNTEDSRSKLIMIEKGTDVEATQRLCRELGISDNVEWVHEMPRNELDMYYRGASICLGQFGIPVITYSILEPLANGSIGVSFFNAPTTVPFYETYPPVFNTRDPNEIALIMDKIMSDQGGRDELSHKSWLWVKRNCSEEKFVEAFVALFRDR